MTSGDDTATLNRSVLPIVAVLMMLPILALVLACGDGSDEPSIAPPAAQQVSTATTATPVPLAKAATTAPTQTPAPRPPATAEPEATPPPATATPTITPAPAGPPTEVPTSTAEPESTPTNTALPAVDADCGSFTTFEEAQRFFLRNGGPSEDRHSLDTDNDSIACNSDSDRGIESAVYSPYGPPTATPIPTATPALPRMNCDDFATWADANEFFMNAGGPYSDPHRLDSDRDGVPCSGLLMQENATATPMPPPTVSPETIWSSPERTAQLNAVDWRAFANNVYGFGAVILEAGTPGSSSWRMPDGSVEWVEVECGPVFGNRFDEGNPTYRQESPRIAIWIEPSDGSEPHCVSADKYLNWLPGEPTRLDSRQGLHSMPKADRTEPLEFTYPDDEARFHTLPPTNPFIVESMVIGDDFAYMGKEGLCSPQTVPLAVWTTKLGFQPLDREEEELLARYSFNYRSFENDPDALWKSYDWTSKEEWREIGWYLVLYHWEYRTVSGINEHWKNNVRYIAPQGVRGGCWFVHNADEVPPPRYCFECERRANMARLAGEQP